jgi:RecJ-like exonuclease
MDEPILVPFGPNRPVPEGYRWCFACNGSGKDCRMGGSCQFCDGKGHWNAEDIKKYHELNPRLCKLSCGERHVPPFIACIH